MTVWTNLKYVSDWAETRPNLSQVISEQLDISLFQAIGTDQCYIRDVTEVQ